MSSFLYRYEAVHGCHTSQIVCNAFPILKLTPKGFWIRDLINSPRWVSASTVKRYAYPTKEEALEAYKYRKKAYVRHCRARLEKATLELELAGKPKQMYDRLLDRIRYQNLKAPL